MARDGRRNRRALAIVSAAVPLLVASLCAPPPDLDGTPPGAVPLELDQWQRAMLDCSRRVADCVDWYRVEIERRGTLQVDIAKMEDDRPVPDYTLLIGDAAGAEIKRQPAGRQTRLRLRQKVNAGTYLLAVTTPPEGAGAMEYELRAKFEPYTPPVQPPRFRKVPAEILELHDGPGGAEAVLIDKGSKAGIAKGQNGRLIKGGTKIADIEVYEVYGEGARAVIRGTLSAPIDAATRVEVDVPIPR